MSGRLHPQELGTFHRLPCTAVDSEWGVWYVSLPEVHSYLFCLVDVEL